MPEIGSSGGGRAGEMASPTGGESTVGRGGGSDGTAKAEEAPAARGGRGPATERGAGIGGTSGEVELEARRGSVGGIETGRGLTTREEIGVIVSMRAAELEEAETVGRGVTGRAEDENPKGGGGEEGGREPCEIGNELGVTRDDEDEVFVVKSERSFSFSDEDFSNEEGSREDEENAEGTALIDASVDDAMEC